MSGAKWKQNEIIAKDELENVSDFARFMVTNQGYYFYDKKGGKAVDKFEIYATFSKEYSGTDELEDVYNGTQKQYERRRK